MFLQLHIQVLLYSAVQSQRRKVEGLLKVTVYAEEVCDCCSNAQLVSVDGCLCQASCSSQGIDTGQAADSALRAAINRIAVVLSEDGIYLHDIHQDYIVVKAVYNLTKLVVLAIIDSDAAQIAKDRPAHIVNFNSTRIKLFALVALPKAVSANIAARMALGTPASTLTLMVSLSQLLWASLRPSQLAQQALGYRAQL